MLLTNTRSALYAEKSAAMIWPLWDFAQSQVATWRTKQQKAMGQARVHWL